MILQVFHMAASILYPSITTRLRRAPRKLFFKTLNGRLPLKQGYDRRETLPKRVSDDSQRFIFRRQKILFDEKIWILKTFPRCGLPY